MKTTEFQALMTKINKARDVGEDISLATITDNNEIIEVFTNEEVRVLEDALNLWFTIRYTCGVFDK